MSSLVSGYPEKNSDGNLRRVGFEIEYIDYSLENSVTLVQNLFGGKITQENDHLYYINETPYGRFSVERDLKMLHTLSDKSAGNKADGKVDLEGAANEILTKLLKGVIPIEIVTPPLHFNQVSLVNEITEALKKTSAHDTNKNIFTAFGLHINPELPNFDVSTILSYLRAYCLLNAWLRKEINVDISRKLSPFIDEYPESFVLLILDEGYSPNLMTLMQDYLKFNNTRNRSLDLLPLFKYLDKDYVLRMTANESIQARPTFHYRLPNTSFRKDDWSVNKEWERWLVVEKLANCSALLSKMSEHYVRLYNEKIFFNKNQWVDETACYLKKLLN